jgi:hypothetical protein
MVKSPVPVGAPTRSSIGDLASTPRRVSSRALPRDPRRRAAFRSDGLAGVPLRFGTVNGVFGAATERFQPAFDFCAETLERFRGRELPGMNPRSVSPVVRRSTGWKKDMTRTFPVGGGDPCRGQETSRARCSQCGRVCVVTDSGRAGTANLNSDLELRTRTVSLSRSAVDRFRVCSRECAGAVL